MPLRFAAGHAPGRRPNNAGCDLLAQPLEINDKIACVVVARCRCVGIRDSDLNRWVVRAVSQQTRSATVGGVLKVDARGVTPAATERDELRAIPQAKHGRVALARCDRPPEQALIPLERTLWIRHPERHVVDRPHRDRWTGLCVRPGRERGRTDSREESGARDPPTLTHRRSFYPPATNEASAQLSNVSLAVQS